MKNALLILAVLFSTSAHAGEMHPCKKIKEACEAAGFTKGGHEQGKGLFKNCMKEIMNGQAVAGVNISAEDVGKCKAKREHFKANHKMKKHHEEAQPNVSTGEALEK